MAKPLHAVLAVVRAVDLARIHPQTDFSHKCAGCGETVGVFPSGQRIIRRSAKVTLICNRCLPPSIGAAAPLAPGALKERTETRSRQ